MEVSKRYKVTQVISSRYDHSGGKSLRSDLYSPDLMRPLSWDERRAGIDVVSVSTGETLKLFSDGGQSVPQPGWEIVLTGGDDATGRIWTLYGLS